MGYLLEDRNKTSTLPPASFVFKFFLSRTLFVVVVVCVYAVFCSLLGVDVVPCPVLT